jgi:hypothetical protein
MANKDDDEVIFTVSGTVRLEPGEKVEPEHRLLLCAQCGVTVQRVSESLDFENGTKTWTVECHGKADTQTVPCGQRFNIPQMAFLKPA